MTTSTCTSVAPHSWSCALRWVGIFRRRVGGEGRVRDGGREAGGAARGGAPPRKITSDSSARDRRRATARPGSGDARSRRFARVLVEELRERAQGPHVRRRVACGVGVGYERSASRVSGAEGRRRARSRPARARSGAREEKQRTRLGTHSRAYAGGSCCAAGPSVSDRSRSRTCARARARRTRRTRRPPSAPSARRRRAVRASPARRANARRRKEISGQRRVTARAFARSRARARGAGNATTTSAAVACGWKDRIRAGCDAREGAHHSARAAIGRLPRVKLCRGPPTVPPAPRGRKKERGRAARVPGARRRRGSVDARAGFRAGFARVRVREGARGSFVAGWRARVSRVSRFAPRAAASVAAGFSRAGS